MKSFGLVRWSLIACLAGMLLLVFLSISGVQHLRQNQAEGTRLIALDLDLDRFTQSAQELLHHQADEQRLNAFRRDASAIRSELETLPANELTAEASRQVSAIEDLITTAWRNRAGEADQASSSEMSQTSAINVSAELADEFARLNFAVDTALDQQLSSQIRKFTLESWWIGGGLFGLSLIFGFLSLIAFLSIHLRVSRPTRALIDTLQALRSGDRDARADVSGGHGIDELAQTLNETLDQLAQSDKTTSEQSRKVEQANAELEATRDRLVRAQQTGRMGSWEVNYPEERVVWSTQALEILGDEPSAAGNTIQGFLRRVHPDDRERLRVEREHWLQNGGEFESDYRIVRDDGTTVWLHARAELSKAADGSVVSSTGTLQDVTELRVQQKWLRIMEELLEGSEDLCGIVDASGRYQWLNRTYRRAYGLDAEEAVGQWAGAVLGETYFQAEVQPHLDDALAGRSPRFETWRNLPESGQRRFLVRYYPIDLPGESDRYVGFVITDVTDLQEARDRIVEQSRLLDVAGRMARVGGWSADLFNNRITWSPVTAEIFGRPADYSPTIEEVIEYFAPEYHDRIRTSFDELVRSGGATDEVAEIIDANGRGHWVHAIAEARRDETGKVVEVHGALGDITDFRKLENERSALSRQLADILASITDGFIAFDRQWQYVYVNPEAERLLDRSADELIGTTVWEQFPELANAESGRAMRKAMDEGVPAASEEFNERLGSWLQARMYPRKDGIAVFFRDVSEQHDLFDRLRTQEADLRSSRDQLQALLADRQALINSLPAHIAMLDAEGTVIDVNERWRHYGLTHENRDPSFGVGTNYLSVCRSATGDCGASAREIEIGLRAVLAGELSQFDLEYACHPPEGQQWFRVVFTRLHDADAHTGAVAMHVDITERKLAEQEMERVAFNDPLTGILSRAGFERRLRSVLAENVWDPDGIVLTFDIVQLRDVNEAHGYDMGDRLLIELSERLRQQVGERGLAARIAGDEFAAYIQAGESESAEFTLESIQKALIEPVKLDQVQIEVDLKLGHTRLGNSSRSVETLIREAELALFEQEANPASTTRSLPFTAELTERSEERIRLTGEMRRALESDEFQLHFQPKVDLADGRVIAAEALLRWQHPEVGLMPPGRFIPIAEQNQMIGPMGRWALRAACRHLRDWKDNGVDLVRVSVNVSLVQFLVTDFPAEVERALSDFNVPAEALSLEITESVFERQSDRMRAEMRKLSELGVRLSLDDFGTGFSSLRYLQQYPFHEIKIDRVFTDAVLTDEYSREIVMSVLKIADAIEAEVVAEGIESAEIAEALLEMGCRIGQGYYFSMPLEVEDFIWLLKKHAVLPLSRQPANH